MYECLYGYTPFACEDRHSTKLKILKHKQTLKFPQMEPPLQPSYEALDFISQLLVEKEKRLCSRKYELNDHMRKRSNNGLFVYADDADSIKKHHFFRNIVWDEMLSRRPPFVPRVKGWEDTKYFDEEHTISDIDIDSSEDVPNVLERKPARPASSDTKIGSKHHQEDQHIVPSAAVKLQMPEASAMMTGGAQGVVTWKDEKLEDTIVEPSPRKRKEKKRPRDKILRDRIGRIAMGMRKECSFLGYVYGRPMSTDEVIKETLQNEGVSAAGL